MRRHIIEEAVRLYHENGGEDGGVQSATVELICERADISVRTFFRYFESKLDVIYLDYRRAMNELLVLVTSRLAHESPERALMSGSIEHFTSFIADNVNRDRLLRAMTSPYFAERRAMWRTLTQENLAGLMEAHLPEGPHSALRAKVLVTAVRGVFDDVMTQWAQEPETSLINLLRVAADEMSDVTKRMAAEVNELRPA